MFVLFALCKCCGSISIFKRNLSARGLCAACDELFNRTKYAYMGLMKPAGISDEGYVEMYSRFKEYIDVLRDGNPRCMSIEVLQGHLLGDVENNARDIVREHYIRVCEGINEEVVELAGEAEEGQDAAGRLKDVQRLHKRTISLAHSLRVNHKTVEPMDGIRKVMNQLRKKAEQHRAEESGRGGAGLGQEYYDVSGEIEYSLIELELQNLDSVSHDECMRKMRRDGIQVNSIHDMINKVDDEVVRRLLEVVARASNSCTMIRRYMRYMSYHLYRTALDVDSALGRECTFIHKSTKVYNALHGHIEINSIEMKRAVLAAISLARYACEFHVNNFEYTPYTLEFAIKDRIESESGYLLGAICEIGQGDTIDVSWDLSQLEARINAVLKREGVPLGAVTSGAMQFAYYTLEEYDNNTSMLFRELMREHCNVEIL